MYLSIYLSIHLSIYPSIYLYIYISIYLIIVAIILAGREASGKTSALKTIISTLNSKDSHTSLSVRSQKIYPGVFQNQSDIFGSIDESGNWRDGIFTSLFRKSVKVHYMYMYKRLNSN